MKNLCLFKNPRYLCCTNLKTMDKVVYQIKEKGITAYASNIASCDALCAIMINNGGNPKVRRMKRTQVPLSDIELVTEL